MAGALINGLMCSLIQEDSCQDSPVQPLRQQDEPQQTGLPQTAEAGADSAALAALCLYYLGWSLSKLDMGIKAAISLFCQPRHWCYVCLTCCVLASGQRTQQAHQGAAQCHVDRMLGYWCLELLDNWCRSTSWTFSAYTAPHCSWQQRWVCSAPATQPPWQNGSPVHILHTPCPFANLTWYIECGTLLGAVLCAEALSSHSQLLP